MGCRTTSRVTQVALDANGDPLANPNDFCLGDRLFAADGSSFTVVQGPSGLEFAMTDPGTDIFTIWMAPAPAGNDANSGLSPSRPVLTLGRALDLVPPGYRRNVVINAADGTYPTLVGDPFGIEPMVLKVGGGGSGGTNSTANGPDTATVILVGGYTRIATRTVTASSPGGNVLSTGVGMPADQYLGAFLRITASPAAPLVGSARTIFETTAGGDFRLSFGFFGPVPVGTTFEVLVPSVIFPYTQVVWDCGGRSVQVQAVEFVRSGAAPASMLVTAGELRLESSKLDLGDNDSVISPREGAQIDLVGAIFNGQLAPLSAANPTAWAFAGSYVRRTTHGLGIATEEVPALGLSLGFGDRFVTAGAVIQNCQIKFVQSGLDLVSTELVGSDVVVTRSGTLYVSSLGDGKSRLAPADAFTISGSIATFTLYEIDGFGGDGIVVAGGSRATMAAVTGTGGGASGYGIHLKNAALVELVQTCTIAGAAVAGSGQILNGNRPITYAELAAVGPNGITDGIQRGKATLDGASPTQVPAFITAIGTQSIAVDHNTPAGGGPGILSVPDAGRTTGSPAPGVPATGSFSVASSVPGETGTIDWVVIDDVQTLCRVVGF